ncbi:hypothetical protein QE247_27460, partial [Klebsiella pneumoniae]|uniref:hypothetical protein n=1 Tax=Klebsiella pneumoniae TaxID=573 RepID=UPI002FF32F44
MIKIEATYDILPKFAGPIYFATYDVTKIKPKIDITFSRIIHIEFDNTLFRKLTRILFSYLLFNIFIIKIIKPWVIVW